MKTNNSISVLPQEAPQTDPVMESDMPSGTVSQGEERSSNGEVKVLNSLFIIYIN